MKRVLVLLALAGMFASANVAQAQGPKKKLLVITESKGFVHDVVRRGKDGSLCLVEKVFQDLAKKAEFFDVVVSQDSRKDLTAENLKDFDAIWFYTTGTLPISDVQKADLLAFIKSGKGFGGSHSATDTFYDWPQYGELIGAYFDGHPWHQKITVVVENTKHPATRHLGKRFDITDEIYQFRTPYSREKLNVLMKLDPEFGAKTRIEETARLENEKAALLRKAQQAQDNGNEEQAKKLRKLAENRRPGVRRSDNDWALAWTREYGKGRVFYTALGHRPEVWNDPRFQEHVIGGLQYMMFLDK